MNLMPKLLHQKLLHHLPRCYRATLWLYPADLRREHGQDMSDAFRQLLTHEFAASGARGIASACHCAAKELFTIAIPAQLSSEWMVLTSLLLALNLGFVVVFDLFFVRPGA